MTLSTTIEQYDDTKLLDMSNNSYKFISTLEWLFLVIVVVFVSLGVKHNLASMDWLGHTNLGVYHNVSLSRKIGMAIISCAYHYAEFGSDNNKSDALGCVEYALIHEVKFAITSLSLSLLPLS